jgi:drug/metabolite transporter (DMT)-like permease
MGHKEALQKRIDNLENKMRYYRTILLTLASAIVWSVYAIMEHKADSKILILSGVGIVLFLAVLIRLKSYEIETAELIEELERIE